ncbi:MAG: EthD domain-containing protein [Sphingorhabdus sp.]
MIKVMWFLKRAEHLTLDQFRRWWLDHHAADIAADQAPFLKGYKIDIRVDDDSAYLGRPVGDQFEWDGIAEQYFDSIDDYNAVYGRTDRKTRQDTADNTSAFARIVVEEHVIL